MKKFYKNILYQDSSIQSNKSTHNPSLVWCLLIWETSLRLLRALIKNHQFMYLFRESLSKHWLFCSGSTTLTIRAGDYTHLCNRMFWCVMNRTTSAPKSVLRYDVDKDLTFVWYSIFTQSCFPNKKTGRRRRVKQFIWVGGTILDPCTENHNQEKETSSNHIQL